MSFLQHTLAHEITAPPHSVSLDSGVSLEFLDTGFLRVRPTEGAIYRVIISCGIHGNETAPMEMVDQLFSEIRSGDLAVANELLFIIGNPPAANRAARFVDENLNRLFSAKHERSRTKESTRAKLIEEHTRRFFNGGDELRLHYDLHTAIRGSEFEKFAVYPFTHERAWSKPQIAFLERCGLQAVLLSNQPSGTYSYYTSNDFNADAFTIELGKVEKFGNNDMTKFEDAMQGLRRLISGQEDFATAPSTIKVFEVVEEVIKRSEDFTLHFADDAKNFTAFAKGSVLASDRDYRYITTRADERFVFPIANVPIGQRAMLVVAPTCIY